MDNGLQWLGAHCSFQERVCCGGVKRFDVWAACPIPPAQGHVPQTERPFSLLRFTPEVLKPLEHTFEGGAERASEVNGLKVCAHHQRISTTITSLLLFFHHLSSSSSSITLSSSPHSLPLGYHHHRFALAVEPTRLSWRLHSFGSSCCMPSFSIFLVSHPSPLVSLSVVIALLVCVLATRVPFGPLLTTRLPPLRFLLLVTSTVPRLTPMARSSRRLWALSSLHRR